MNYSQAGIANLALNRIGARGQITDVNENSPNAKKVLAVWDYVFQEVLSERDWKFAKIQSPLVLSAQPPLYGYCYAWALPSDFLRFVRPRRKQFRLDSVDYFWYGLGPYPGWYRRNDWPFHPYCDYKVETLPGMCQFIGSISGFTLTVSQIISGSLALNQYVTDTTKQVQSGTVISAFGTGQGLVGDYTVSISQNVTQEMMYSPNPTLSSGLYALTNYDGCRGPVKITYIRLITDYTQLMPGFVNCLAYRLAAELAIGITEDKAKFSEMEQMYRDSLNSAEAINECLDFEADEAGSETWVRAGRYWGGAW